MAGDLLAAGTVLLGPDRQDGVEGFVFAAAVLADVEVGFELAADLIEQPLLGRQDRHQFGAAHVVATEDRLAPVAGVLGCHQIHRNIGLLALDQTIVNLLGKGVVVAITTALPLKADLVAAQHIIKHHAVQGLNHHRIRHLNPLDLLLHILFLVGEELVDLTVALQVALAVQVDQGILHRLLMGADVEIGLID